MSWLNRCGACFLGLVLNGCGTTLEVTEENRGIAAPDGIVMNARQVYDVAAISTVTGITVSGPGQLHGVRQERVLVVDVDRMPFGSGKLTLTLTADQTIETIGIESSTGAVRAVAAGAAGVEARNKLRDERQARDDKDEKD